MSLIQKALGAFGLQRKSIGITWADGRKHGTPGIAGELVTAESALGLSAVWACANLISGTISSLPLASLSHAGRWHAASGPGPSALSGAA
jgi:hypothetical protein